MTKTLEERAADLLPRLVGNYIISVNDGAGLLNGKDKFERSFPVPPINNEAAKLIADQQACIRDLEAEPYKFSSKGLTGEEEVRINEGSDFISLNDSMRLKELHEWVREIHYELKEYIVVETTEEEIEAVARAIRLGNLYVFDGHEYQEASVKLAKAALEAARKVRINKEGGE